MGVAPRHLQAFMPEQFRDVSQRGSVLTEAARERVPEIMPSKIRSRRLSDCFDKPMGIDVERLAGAIAYHATRPVPPRAEDHQSAHGVLVQWDIHGVIVFRHCFSSLESWRPAP